MATTKKIEGTTGKIINTQSWWGYSAFYGGSNTFGDSVKLDKSTERVGIQFVAPYSGNITKIIIYTYYASFSTPPTFNIGLKAWDDNKHGPGNWLGNTNQAFSAFQPISSQEGFAEITLTEVATLIKGQVYFVWAEYSSGTIGSSNYWQIGTMGNSNVIKSRPNLMGEHGNLARGSIALWYVYDGFICRINDPSDGWPVFGLEYSNDVKVGQPYTKTGYYNLGQKSYGSGEIYQCCMRFQVQDWLKISKFKVSLAATTVGDFPTEDPEYEIRGPDSESILRNGTMTGVAASIKDPTEHQWFEKTLSSELWLEPNKTYRFVLKGVTELDNDGYRVRCFDIESDLDYGESLAKEFVFSYPNCICEQADYSGGGTFPDEGENHSTYTNTSVLSARFLVDTEPSDPHRSITAKANIRVSSTQSLTAKANIQSTNIGQTITSKAKIVCIPKPVLVTPATETIENSPVYFVWEIPTCCKNRNMHAHIQIDKTDNTFGDLEKDLSSYRDSDFEYWDGGAWQPYPTAGVTSAYYENQARVQVTLTNGDKYWRVKGEVK